MPSAADSFTGPPSILDRDLNKHFPELLTFESTAEMEASALYPKIKEDVERILNAVVVVSVPPAVAGGFAPPSNDPASIGNGLQPPATAGGTDAVRRVRG